MTELISKNIRAQRLAQGMTQEQLAAKVFTTRQCISNYETGKSKPDYETIGKIAMAPGISAEELLYDASERRTEESKGVVYPCSDNLFLWTCSLSLPFKSTNQQCHNARASNLCAGIYYGDYSSNMHFLRLDIDPAL